MLSEISKLLSVGFGIAFFVGLTTYYSMNTDTARVVRRSIRALNRKQYFRYEHLVYLIVKTGQLRAQLFGGAVLSYVMHLFLNFLGI
jgi:hypothetical protein